MQQKKEMKARATSMSRGVVEAVDGDGGGKCSTSFELSLHLIYIIFIQCTSL